MIMAGILQENLLSPRNSEIKNLNELNSKWLRFDPCILFSTCGPFKYKDIIHLEPHSKKKRKKKTCEGGFRNQI